MTVFLDAIFCFIVLSPLPPKETSWIHLRMEDRRLTLCEIAETAGISPERVQHQLSTMLKCTSVIRRLTIHTLF